MSHLKGEEYKNCSKVRALLGQLAHMMPQDPSLRDVAQRVLWLAGEIAWSDSLVIFLMREGKLETEVFRSPHHEVLTRTTNLGIQDPLVQQALREQEPVRLNYQDRGGHRVFADEPTALAIPIHDYGVLYLGRRSDHSYQESEVAALTELCRQGHFAILLAQKSMSQKASLAEDADSRQIAESLLNNVSSLVELMSDLLVLTDPEQVLHHTGHNLFRLANFEFWAIIAGHSEADEEPQYFLTGPARHVEIDRAATLALANKARDSGRTLSFMQMDRLTLPTPSPHIKSTLICPMLADGRVIGCLFLACVRPCFSRHERELLSTLALQVGSHFWNLHLHQELLGAHKSLKLSQAQLVQSSKMAAVGQLAAGVAHEINTPLGAMNLAIEGALKVLATKPERAANRLERALKSGNQLREIVSKLLHYSKKASFEGSDTDLNEVVSDTVNLVRHQLMLENVTIRTDLEKLNPITANHNELQQVLVNLLTNAKDAIVGKSGTQREIVVSTCLADGKVALNVEDPGIGMDQETLAKAFDPFYTTKDVGRGTGLGLSVSSELVKQNGGTIAVSSTPGVGTKFTLLFPQ